MKAKRTQGLAKKGKPVMIERHWVPLFFGAIAVLLLSAGCLAYGPIRGASYEPGIYEGTGRGFRGPVLVRVQVDQAGIEDIVITGHEDSVFPGVAAMEELLELVLEYGSTDLDAVSGATFSSRGFLEAVENALDKARGQAR